MDIPCFSPIVRHSTSVRSEKALTHSDSRSEFNLTCTGTSFQYDPALPFQACQGSLHYEFQPKPSQVGRTYRAGMPMMLLAGRMTGGRRDLLGCSQWKSMECDEVILRCDIPFVDLFLLAASTSRSASLLFGPTFPFRASVSLCRETSQRIRSSVVTSLSDALLCCETIVSSRNLSLCYLVTVDMILTASPQNKLRFSLTSDARPRSSTSHETLFVFSNSLPPQSLREFNEQRRSTR
eukprot:252341-Hanusia_phi.AAC.1